MSKVARYLLVIVMCSVAYSSVAQNYQLHTVYIYSFIRYIQWPDNSGDFTFGVLGDSPINTHLEKMASSKKAGARTIRIIRFSNVDVIRPTDILFISKSVEDSVESFVVTTSNNHTLTITEKEGEGMAGSAINFIEKNGKLAFELNKSSIEKAGLRVSSELSRLAIII